jgi:hypothetical protein
VEIFWAKKGGLGRSFHNYGFRNFFGPARLVKRGAVFLEKRSAASSLRRGLSSVVGFLPFATVTTRLG